MAKKKKVVRKKKATKKAPAARSKATKKKAAKTTTARRRGAMNELDKKTLQLIADTATRVRSTIERRTLPELKFPIRSLKNVTYKKDVGYFEIGRGTKVRQLSVNTVRSFAQTLRLMSISKDMVENDDFATKREAYYVSKNWGDAKFKDQPESDAVMDDIEALASVDGLSREQLRYYPEEHGGSVAGNLTVIDRTPRRARTSASTARPSAPGSYSIPHSVEHLKLRDRRQVRHRDRDRRHVPAPEQPQVLEAGEVHPGRDGRRADARHAALHPPPLGSAPKIPVYAFVDCDPYGIANIYRTLKVGSGNAAHINRFFCVPKAQYLGVTPQDIVDFKLEDATHALQAVDIKRAKDALKNDPFFGAHKKWKSRPSTSSSRSGVRAEQQALAKWGLNFVIEEYLPRKLRDKKSFLP